MVISQVVWQVCGKVYKLNCQTGYTNLNNKIHTYQLLPFNYQLACAAEPAEHKMLKYTIEQLDELKWYI